MFFQFNNQRNDYKHLLLYSLKKMSASIVHYNNLL